MKVAAITLLVTLALGASSAFAQGGHAHAAAPEPAPCCDTGAKGYQASGVVKKSDSAKSTVTIAHGAVKELSWPAMTMAFKVKDKALLSKLTVDRKVDFSFTQDGKDYVIIAVR